MYKDVFYINNILLLHLKNAHFFYSLQQDKKLLLEQIAQTIAGNPAPLPISNIFFLFPINFKNLIRI